VTLPRCASRYEAEFLPFLERSHALFIDTSVVRRSSLRPTRAGRGLTGCRSRRQVPMVEGDGFVSSSAAGIKPHDTTVALPGLLKILAAFVGG